MLPAEAKPPKFQWPPAAAPAADPPPQAEPRPDRSGAAGNSLDLDAPSRGTGWWPQIEDAWLGFSRPPLLLRAARAGWAPDEPWANCPRCAGSSGSFEVDAKGCLACRELRLPWSRAVRLARYEGELRAMIHDVKFTAWRRLALDLGRLLGAAIARTIEQAAVRVEPATVTLVPVPSTLWRRLARGIDHTAVLAKGAAEVLEAPVVHALRRDHRPPQTSRTVSQRAANVRGCMKHRGHDLSDKTAVLIDDVRTSGATLAEACRALRAAPRERWPRSIWVATLGVTEPERT